MSLEKRVLNVIHYLIDTFVYHGFIRFPAGSHKLCTLVLDCIELLLQPVDLLLESLQK